MLTRYYNQRIKKPIDVLKQPYLDIERMISRSAYYLLKRLKSHRQRPEPVRRLLIIRRNKIGDAINVLPIIDILKESYPEIEINVLANPYNSHVFRMSSNITKVFTVPERYLAGYWGLYFHPTYKEIRRLKLDMSIVVGSYSSRAAVMAFYCGASFRAGVISNKGSIYDLLYDLPLSPEVQRAEEHQVIKTAAQFHLAGFDIPLKIPEIKMPRCSEPEQGLVCICPDVPRKSSRLPAEYYAGLISLLGLQPWVKEIRLLLHGKNSPYWRLVNETPVMHVATPSFHEFIKELALCKYVVTAEGGTSHLAAAIGVPTVVLSGVNINKTWIPWSSKAVLLEKTDAVNEIPVTEIMEQLKSYQNTGTWLVTEHAYFAGTKD